ncbi:hypothetical protein B0T14DRAFT_414427, partial [Immersiella caudata]
IVAHIQSLFQSYHQTASIPDRARFYSPQCMQTCRPQSSYSARDSETIVRYLHEADTNNMNFNPGSGSEPTSTLESKGGEEPGFTFRGITDEEFDFGGDEITKWVGLTELEMKEKALMEEWVGTRVDLRFPVVDSGNGEEGMMVVKVRYWWRREGEKWVQILHDILDMG